MYLKVPTGVRAAAVLGVAVLLASCGATTGPRRAVPQDDAVRSGDGALVTPGAVAVFDVRVGDCFMDDELLADDISELVDVEAVPCDERHHHEVYATFDLPEGDYPSQDEIIRLTAEGCVERFADFAGIDYESTRLEVTYLFPLRQSWEVNDDREVVCAVFDPAGPLEGSVAGAGMEYALPTVGDCMDVEGAPVDCASDHDSELYLATELEGDEYPGDLGIEDEAAQLCIAAFEDYVGADYEESALDFLFFAPDQPAWDAGSREVTCAVYDPAGPLTGSVRGSGT